ncbi:FmdE family protein [Desulfoferrobacter suflitae]|uniref:FmdE family protein n=1 Tax=Desulfoferrobacter suflitae TaxID=2865782 RepID=UPI0021644905|nr:FmdE family protein [Desulfoferrobacter suflitae]MCK8601150.1 FmdE family protein [Desulfoferrobacter suflitae]
MSTEYPQDLQEVIRFHGHMCPGLAIGYRAAKAAQARLDVARPEDEELVAIVESDGCGIDAIQAMLGCTLGKGNLIYRDHGKQVYTIICRERGRAVRVAAKPGLFNRNPDQEAVFQKVLGGRASEEERQTFWAFQKEKVAELLAADLDAIFTITDVSPEVPEKARIFKSVNCAYCGEPVMEPRARIRDGKHACIPCSESYGRGW